MIHARCDTKVFGAKYGITDAFKRVNRLHREGAIEEGRKGKGLKTAQSDCSSVNGID